MFGGFIFGKIAAVLAVAGGGVLLAKKVSETKKRIALISEGTTANYGKKFGKISSNNYQNSVNVSTAGKSIYKKILTKEHIAELPNYTASTVQWNEVQDIILDIISNPNFGTFRSQIITARLRKNDVINKIYFKALGILENNSFPLYAPNAAGAQYPKIMIGTGYNYNPGSDKFEYPGISHLIAQ